MKSAPEFGRPASIVIRIAKRSRHDADDRFSPRAEPELPPQNVRIAAKTALPQSVADNNNVPLGIFGNKTAAHHGSRAEQVEVVGGYAGAEQQLGLAFSGKHS